MTRPFEGVKISRLHAGTGCPRPRSAALLGADVIKVERREGEDMRRTPLSREWAERGLAPGWQAINGNKRSLTLDLSKPEAIAIVKQLAAQPDVVMEKHPMEDLFSGLKFVWRTKAILATVTLDLFAVLLGGATASCQSTLTRFCTWAPSVSVGCVQPRPSGRLPWRSRWLTFRRCAGPAMTLLVAVAGFGVAILVFGISRSFWLSLVALIFTGAFDNISVVVRHTLVQPMTPDAMRGRVAAVNNVFIGSSNELGAFESGVTAALLGPVLSVVIGGIGTIVVVVAVALKWPEVRAIGSLASVHSPARVATRNWKWKWLPTRPVRMSRT